MPRNKIPLCAFIGFLAIVFGLFLLSIGLIFVLEIRGRVASLELAIISAPIIAGGGLLLSGIGLLKRKQWARKLINFILFSCILLCSVLLFFFIQDLFERTYWSSRIIIQIGMILFVFSLLAGLFLFVNNTQITDELMNKEDPP